MLWNPGYFLRRAITVLVVRKILNGVVRESPGDRARRFAKPTAAHPAADALASALVSMSANVVIGITPASTVKSTVTIVLVLS